MEFYFTIWLHLCSFHKRTEILMYSPVVQKTIKWAFMYMLKTLCCIFKIGNWDGEVALFVHAQNTTHSHSSHTIKSYVVFYHIVRYAQIVNSEYCLLCWLYWIEHAYWISGGVCVSIGVGYLKLTRFVSKMSKL